MAASHSKGLFIVLTISCVCGFNIDTKIPFIRTGPVNSYFGFSIAEHMITKSNGDIAEKVLLVGSPKLSRPGDRNNKTGGLYKCSFNSWCKESCAIQLQAESDDITSIAGTRTDQWFGSVVRSSGKGGYVVVCAHRYTINYSGVGKCIALRESLTFHKLVTPCEDDRLQHKGTAYCQAGTSADINFDGTVVVGGPGAGDWTGGVFTLLVKRQLGVSLIYYSSPWREEPERKPPPVDLSSYMGYSVTSGHYYSTNTKDMMYVGGSPHANGTGQVVLFYQETGGYLKYRDNQIIKGDEQFSLFGFELATVDLNNDSYDDLIVGSPLHYEKSRAGGAIYVYMGKAGGITGGSKPIKITNQKESEEECAMTTCTESRFGFSLAPAGDINLDGYQDLVVGAPYEENGKGAIYLFHGSADGIVKKYAQRISGKEIDPTIMTFGHAISGQMDLDGNGYDDVAVGSYQSDTTYLLRTRPIVHLSAKLKVFPNKFNLSQPPDCIIPNNDMKKYCINLQLCMSFTAKPLNSFNTPQSILYTIEVEKGVSKKRALFVNPGGTIKKSITDLNEQKVEVCTTEKVKLIDSFNDKLTPISFTVTYNLADIPYPDPSQCSNGVPDINKYPVLVTGMDESTTLVTKVNFSRECGANDICESNIQLTTDLLNLTLPRDNDGTVVLSYGEDKVVIVDVKLDNRGEPAYETNLYVTVPESFEWNRLDVINPPNHVPVRTNPTTTIVELSDIGNPFGNQAKTTNLRHYRLRFNPLEGIEKKFKIIVHVNTTSVEQTVAGDRQEFNVRVINRAEVELQSSAAPDGDVFYRGPVRGVSSMKTESDIGPAINHTFTVVNHGPGTIDGATLRIYWPFELKTDYPEGKQLLYLMQEPVVIGGPAECPSYSEFVNSLDIKENPNLFIRPKNAITNVGPQTQGTGPQYKVIDSSRKKRETKTSTNKPPKIRKQEIVSKNVVKLNCNNKANCRVMECRIRSLAKGGQTTVLLRGRLWESTLVQDYPSVDEVWIASTGQVILDTDLNIEQNIADDIAEAITYSIPDLKERISDELQWWIILVAVLAGLLVLIIFILILWKCGFFKRLRPEGYQPTYKGDLKKKDYESNDAAYS
ncbi:integrin alpha-PS1-like isoform X1 [Mytilus californianus]|uniref:integrin alpha-PS1-like isoform X1 n=1 Tax=Mytilus californianus TaxID=6549 RepID=UPI0022451605|nr:integrin alpha-PS1-like isoform X1 [Mytilus californianus]